MDIGGFQDAAPGYTQNLENTGKWKFNYEEGLRMENYKLLS
jgi:hypothetical protein